MCRLLASLCRPVALSDCSYGPSCRGVVGLWCDDGETTHLPEEGAGFRIPDNFLTGMKAARTRERLRLNGIVTDNPPPIQAH